MSADVRVLAGPEEVAAEAARVVAERLAAAVATRGEASLVMSGGSTPRRTYEALAGRSLPWERVHVYWGDERCVAPDHEASNYRMAREALLDRVVVPQGNVHRIEAEREPQAAAQSYERELARLGVPPAFDVVLLGMGDDGHTASLFPGSALLEERSRLVGVAEQAGMTRISLTFPAFAASRSVIFLVVGAAKAAALSRALSGLGDPSVPASRVETSGELIWLVDAPAAASLTKGAP